MNAVIMVYGHGHSKSHEIGIMSLTINASILLTTVQCLLCVLLSMSYKKPIQGPTDMSMLNILSKCPKPARR